VCRLAYNGAVAAGQLAVFQGASEAPMGAVMAVATEDRALVPVGMAVAMVPIPGTAALARATAADPPPAAAVRATILEVIVAILTDGLENASQEFTRNQISK
jgi:hypothetical protein